MRTNERKVEKLENQMQPEDTWPQSLYVKDPSDIEAIKQPDRPLPDGILARAEEEYSPEARFRLLVGKQGIAVVLPLQLTPEEWQRQREEERE